MPRTSHIRATASGRAGAAPAGSAGGRAASCLLVAALVLLLTAFPGGPAAGSGGAAFAASGVTAAAGSGGDGQMVLVLDASGSMKEPAGDGRTRFAAAVTALKEVVRALPADLDVGLRVYGSKISDGPGSCKDSELVVPVGPKDAGALNKALDRAKPLGNTPIAFSLQEAAEDLPAEGSRSIVLVSDGEESCGGDPCRVARDLSQQGLDLHVDVVGFQVDQAARNQLTCIAQAGRGTFYDAPDATSLVNQLSRLSQRAARAYEPAGIPVEGTDTADGAPLLEPGEYLDTLGDGTGTETYRVEPAEGSTVHLGATVRPTSKGNADLEQLTVAVAAADGTECADESESSQGAFDELSPLSTVLSISGDDLAGCGAAPYAVAVSREANGSVTPLELTYVLEPEVQDPDALPAAVEDGSYDVRNRTQGKAVPAFGAPAFAAAPQLEPGVYADSILEGEALYYGVALDWGQQLVCDITYRTTPATDAAINASSINGKIRMHGPLGDKFYDAAFNETDSDTYDGSTPITVHYATPPVRYHNRDGSLGVIPAALPGTYYCGAFLSGAGDYPELSEVPITVTLDVVGKAGEGAPTYTDGTSSPSASPSSAASQGPTGSDGDPAAAPADDGSGGFPLWGWLLVVLVVLGAALALLSRRSPRRS
ncbi:VWA domain-containing protein [Nocardioides mesophilus]|uniref:VWA domain-containing protein n=1 Tax=Nocardioides mesophilus TaxID=433659 RepID=A0A7G9REX7_9ACTN|nr:VWA domain-containing protein [Nocardioides mesophilus]QNN54152.1 VWA domain-containing protein [Nocardioides mesophilus]